MDMVNTAKNLQITHARFSHQTSIHAKNSGEQWEISTNFNARFPPVIKKRTCIFPCLNRSNEGHLYEIFIRP